MPTVIEPFDRSTVVTLKVADAEPVSGTYFPRPVAPAQVVITYRQTAGADAPYVVHVMVRGLEMKSSGEPGRRQVEHISLREEWPSWIVAAVRRNTPPPFAPHAVVTGGA